MAALSPATMNAIEGLTALRNLAAHGQANDLDEVRAVEFLTMTDAVAFTLTQTTEPTHGAPPA